ncbi:MAG TPA: PhzF family phenazine biosynthesis protein [Candidatus Sulfotelmatobacter sp.]|nr:PhzF family phenazine biosynthesis protein [Candidatus Sulfotelmatobacter sp.]
MRIPVFHVDAFTEQPFRGNPAAVCFLDSWLDEGRLLKVAAENNLSATAFLVSGDRGYELRWFTPRCEVKLCGHATLATAHILLNLQHPQLDSVTFETRFRGTVTVRRDGQFLTIDFPAMFPKVCATAPTGLTGALGLQSQSADILEANDTYILVVDAPETVRAVRPNFELLENFHPFVIAITAHETEVDFVSRYFAPSYGIPEDPVTGSAHCVLAPYWAKRLGKTTLHARQLSERGGELWCEVAGDRVLLKGKAVVTLEGSLLI